MPAMQESTAAYAAPQMAPPPPEPSIMRERLLQANVALEDFLALSRSDRPGERDMRIAHLALFLRRLIRNDAVRDRAFRAALDQPRNVPAVEKTWKGFMETVRKAAEPNASPMSGAMRLTALSAFCATLIDDEHLIARILDDFARQIFDERPRPEGQLFNMEASRHGNR